MGKLVCYNQVLSVLILSSSQGTTEEDGENLISGFSSLIIDTT